MPLTPPTSSRSPPRRLTHLADELASADGAADGQPRAAAATPATSLCATQPGAAMTPAVSDHYDLIVVGAGSGGYVAAIRAAQLGMSVGIIEERYWGGVCLNTGCVPSKALLRNAEIASIITHGSTTFGISGDVNLDYARAVSRSREVAEARVRGVHFLMRKNNITEIDGRGRFTSPDSIHIDLREEGSKSISFDHAVIATGSRVRMLPGVALSDNIVTYEEQILSADLPDSVVIIGGGAIGMEFAYILH